MLTVYNCVSYPVAAYLYIGNSEKTPGLRTSRTRSGPLDDPSKTLDPRYRELVSHDHDDWPIWPMVFILTTMDST